MKCPDCGKKLSRIEYTKNEYICINDDCLANKELRSSIHIEYYGDTQEEINKQKRVGN